MTSQSIFSLNEAEFQNIDVRLKPFLKGWKLTEEYENQHVEIPGTWDSAIFPFRYFVVVKKPGDQNYKEDQSQNEICLCLWAGWRKYHNEYGWQVYDDECEIVLWISRKAVLDTTQKKVSAEIFKTGGAPMKLFFHDKLVTDFKKKEGGWFPKIINLDKVWIEDITSFLPHV